MTIVYAPDLWPRRADPKQTRHDAAIREACGVDPAIIAATLDISERFVRMRQRKLGLRKCRNPRDKEW